MQLAGDEDPDGLRLIFRTDNADAYRAALDAEGTERRVIAHWHTEQAMRVLDDLQFAEAAL